MKKDLENSSINDKLAVIGAGCWGTALAAVEAENFSHVTLFTPEVDVCEEIAAHRTNSRYLDDFLLPSNIHPTSSLTEAIAEASMLIIVVPSHAIRAVAKQLKEVLPEGLDVVIATKGLEQNTGLLSLEVWREEFPASHLHPRQRGDREPMVLSGPNLAREICAGMPAISLLAGTDVATTKRVATRLTHPLLAVMPYHDPIGVQVAGALKNVYAVGCGIASALDWGDNATAALMWRGLNEIAEFAQSAGGDPAVVMTPAGIGDFVATCSSPLSRNHDLGRVIAGGADENEEIRGVREGAQTAQEALRRSRAMGLDLKLLEAVWSVMAGAENPRFILQVACSAEPVGAPVANGALSKIASGLPAFGFKAGVLPE